MREVVGNWGWAENAAGFSRAHPDESAGYQAVLSSVEEKLARAKVVAAEQRSGLLGSSRERDQRSGSYGARCARRTWPIIAQVAKAARREAPEVPLNFVFRPGTGTHAAFQTTARAFLTEAETTGSCWCGMGWWRAY